MPVYRRINRAERLAAYKSGIFRLNPREEYADNMRLWLPLGKFGGVHEEDYSGRGHHGTRTGGPTKKASHNPIKGPLDVLSVDGGTDDHIVVGDSDKLDMGTGDFTTSLWVKNPTNSAQALFNKKDEDNFDSSGWAIYVSGPPYVLQARIGDGNSNTITTGDGTSINDGIWHHLVVVFDRDGNAVRYVDGAQDGSVDDITSESSSVTNSRPVLTGKRNRSGSELHVTGQIDDVRIYDRALSESYIRRELFLNGGLNSVLPPVFRTYSFPAAGPAPTGPPKGSLAMLGVGV